MGRTKDIYSADFLKLEEKEGTRDEATIYTKTKSESSRIVHNFDNLVNVDKRLAIS